MRQAACFHRARALEEALRFDDFGGFVLGWTNHSTAESALGRTFVASHRNNPLPIAVAIGCGGSIAEARRSAADHGYSRLLRSAAECVEGPPALIDVIRRYLPQGPVDVNRIIWQIQNGTDETPQPVDASLHRSIEVRKGKRRPSP